MTKHQTYKTREKIMKKETYDYGIKRGDCPLCLRKDIIIIEGRTGTNLCKKCHKESLIRKQHLGEV